MSNVDVSENRKEFLRNKIAKQFDYIKGNMEPIAEKLFDRATADCNSYETLREMAEVELIDEYLAYTEKVQHAINRAGTSIEEIKNNLYANRKGIEDSIIVSKNKSTSRVLDESLGLTVDDLDDTEIIDLMYKLSSSEYLSEPEEITNEILNEEAMQEQIDMFGCTEDEIINDVDDDFYMDDEDDEDEDGDPEDGEYDEDDEDDEDDFFMDDDDEESEDYDEDDINEDEEDDDFFIDDDEDEFETDEDEGNTSEYELDDDDDFFMDDDDEEEDSEEDDEFLVDDDEDFYVDDEDDIEDDEYTDDEDSLDEEEDDFFIDDDSDDEDDEPDSEDEDDNEFFVDDESDEDDDFFVDGDDSEDEENNSDNSDDDFFMDDGEDDGEFDDLFGSDDEVELKLPSSDVNAENLKARTVDDDLDSFFDNLNNSGKKTVNKRRQENIFINGTPRGAQTQQMFNLISKGIDKAFNKGKGILK